ncbi:MAG: hypothetical protein U0793_04760 [Gemmataceae bacterium]
MAQYRFITTWRLAHPIDRVYAALRAMDVYPRWWPSFREAKRLNPEVRDVGEHWEFVVKGKLPYRLRYQIKMTAVEAPRLLAYDALGDLEGGGRTELKEEAGRVVVTTHWNVQTHGFWLNLLAPLLRWLFAWNHNSVMRRGEKGLTAWLDGAPAVTGQSRMA